MSASSKLREDIQASMKKVRKILRNCLKNLQNLTVSSKRRLPQKRPQNVSSACSLYVGVLLLLLFFIHFLEIVIIVRSDSPMYAKFMVGSSGTYMTD